MSALTVCINDTSNVYAKLISIDGIIVETFKPEFITYLLMSKNLFLHYTSSKLEISFRRLPKWYRHSGLTYRLSPSRGLSGWVWIKWWSASFLPSASNCAGAVLSRVYRWPLKNYRVIKFDSCPLRSPWFNLGNHTHFLVRKLQIALLKIHWICH